MNFRSFALISLLAAACPAGVIVTGDGTRYEGDVQRADGGWKITSAAGKTNFVAASNVKSIELSGGVAANAGEGLQSLRRSVDASDDLPKIIDRYKRFIEQTGDAAAVASAKDDLKTWQDRLDHGLVKAGGKWVTADEKAAMSAAASRSAQDARLLMKAGQTKEAQTLLDAALQQDSTNISALYLQGVLAEQHGDLQSARKDFAAVQLAAPTHAPSLMNQGIIAMRQKQWGAACLLVDQALTAAPNVMPLIDGAAELLAALPDEQRKASAALKLAKTFADQDAALQKTIAARKMYRWGSTWADQATMDKIIVAETAAKKKVQDLQSDFDLTQGRIKSIDTQTNDNNRAMRDMESHSWVPMADGTYVRAPLPNAYFDLQKQNSQLHGERLEMANRLTSLRDAAKRAKDDLPVPKFTGHINLIGEDGMPVVNIPAPVAPAASTAPATAPAISTPPFIKIGPASDGN